MRPEKRLKGRLAAMLCLMPLLAWPAMPSFACPDTQSEQKKTFELSAIVTDKPQLSRAEIDPRAVGMGMSAMPANKIAAPRLSSRLPAAQPLPSALKGQSAQADQKNPASYLAEYDVDWSSWVSRLADNWFYILRTAENGFGIQFQTERPALIQFTCYADGTIGNVSLKQSSGVPAYDQLQIQTLLLSTPLAPFPAGTRRKTLTLVQGWESHRRQPGENDFQPGSFGRTFPQEKVNKWVAER